MGLYRYTALTTTGRKVSGESFARDHHDLSMLLTAQGLIVQSAKPVSERSFFKNKVSLKQEELYIFNQEFIALLKAAVPIPQIIDSLSERPAQKNFQHVLTNIAEQLKQGVTLSNAFKAHPGSFDGMYIASLQVGEQSGDLVKTLSRYQHYLKLRMSLNKKVKQAMVYPIFLVITLFLVLGVLFSFVMPRFVSMYADFDAELPGPTLVLLGIVENIHITIPVLLMTLLSITLIYRAATKSSAGRFQKDKILLKLPILREFIDSYVRSSVSRVLSTLMFSGMPIVDAMNTTISSIQNQVYRLRLSQSLQLIKEGISLSEAFGRSGVLPDISLKLLKAGETSGKLADMLDEVADYNEEKLDYRLTRLMSIIEPLMMLIIGVIIGGIILVMYLPIFSVADIIK